MALLEVAGVSKRFGGLAALQDVDLDVNAGSIHAIIGPNGAGKSTLLNVLTGRIEPDRGSVMFDGVSVLGVSPHAINQRGIARVYQTPEIFPEMTLLENVAIAALAARDGSFRFNLFQHPRDLKGIAAEAEVGKIYKGTVRKIVEFGAFVEILPGTDGLIHISQLAPERVRKVTDVLKEGDEVMVKVLEIDRQGKIRLSRKEALQETGRAALASESPV